MIWIDRNNKGELCYLTADGKKFNKMSIAMSHLNCNIDKLEPISDTFGKNFDRIKKIDKIKKNIKKE